MQLKSKLRQLRRDMLNVPKMFINIYRLKRHFPQMKIYTYRALVKSIEKRNDVCHVIATGYSAVDAYNSGVVQPGDYIIGINFAAFLPYQFDFYFFEEVFGSCDFRKPRTKGITELLNKRKDNIPNLVYKNAQLVDIKMMAACIPDVKFSVVYDRQFVYQNVKKLFAPPSVIMPQYSSSTITAIMLAYHAGFKNIVVHGLDFSGPYLYHDEDVQKQAGISAPTPYVTKDVKHITAAGQEAIWPKLMQTFAEKNVNVYSASPNSNFCMYAKSYSHIQ